MADQGADATPAQALIAKWRKAAADGDPCCALTRLHDADELEVALAVSPQDDRAATLLAIAGLVNGYQNDGTMLSAAETVQAIAKCLGDPFVTPAVSPQGWQPIESAPTDREVFFWVVPKSAAEAWHDTSGKPITASFAGHFEQCKFRGWSALSKATHWHELLPSPPRVAAGPEEK